MKVFLYKELPMYEQDNWTYDWFKREVYNESDELIGYCCSANLGQDTGVLDQLANNGVAIYPLNYCPPGDERFTYDSGGEWICVNDILESIGGKI